MIGVEGTRRRRSFVRFGKVHEEAPGCAKGRQGNAGCRDPAMQGGAETARQRIPKRLVAMFKRRQSLRFATGPFAAQQPAYDAAVAGFRGIQLGKGTAQLKL